MNKRQKKKAHKKFRLAIWKDLRDIERWPGIDKKFMNQKFKFLYKFTVEAKDWRYIYGHEAGE